MTTEMQYVSLSLKSTLKTKAKGRTFTYRWSLGRLRHFAGIVIVKLGRGVGLVVVAGQCNIDDAGSCGADREDGEANHHVAFVE